MEAAIAMNRLEAWTQDQPIGPAAARAGRRWAATGDRESGDALARNRLWSLRFPPCESGSPNRRRGEPQLERRDGWAVRRQRPEAAPGRKDADLRLAFL